MAPLHSDYLAGIGSDSVRRARRAGDRGGRARGGRPTNGGARGGARFPARPRDLAAGTNGHDRPRAGRASAGLAAVQLRAARRGPRGRSLDRGGRAGAGRRERSTSASPWRCRSRCRPRRPRSARSGAPARGAVLVAAALVVLATGGFWYLRNALVTGNPFYPVATLGLPGLTDRAAMRAWIYHLPIGRPRCPRRDDWRRGTRIRGRRGGGHRLAAPAARSWAPAGARGGLLALDSLSREPVPVPRLRRGGGGDRAGDARARLPVGARSTGAWASCSPACVEYSTPERWLIVPARRARRRRGRRVDHVRGPSTSSEPFDSGRRCSAAWRGRRARRSRSGSNVTARAIQVTPSAPGSTTPGPGFGQRARRARRLHRHEPRLSAGGPRSRRTGSPT